MPTGTTPPPGPLSRHVAQVLSAEMHQRGLRQTDVAAHAGMSASQLSRALSATKVFTLDQLDAVCRAIGVRIADVVSVGRRGAVAELDVRRQRDDDRAVAKKRGGDRGGDDGDG